MDLGYIWSFLMIVIIDIVLGGDNAIVIALACRKLPYKQRNIAIIFGSITAIVLRIILTIGAIYVLKVPFLHLIGGILLLYIACKLIIQEEDNLSSIKENYTVFHAIRTIVFADLVMGIDNVLAIAGASNGKPSLVIIGLSISIPIIIWGSKVVLWFLERYPVLSFVGASVLSITASKMLIDEPAINAYINGRNDMELIVSSSCVIFTIIIGYYFNNIRYRKRTS
ncbi:TerC family protein [Gottfriedia sp. NPDC056225]|uniref:TerC family protein n=1 Tax=Gottfriedia sp. NPDC056225 TaxID=3345751 RepID=UPI0015588C28|nr:TerC family protein [Arthrobacter citreus]